MCFNVSSFFRYSFSYFLGLIFPLQLVTLNTTQHAYTKLLLLLNPPHSLSSCFSLVDAVRWDDLLPKAHAVYFIFSSLSAFAPVFDSNALELIFSCSILWVLFVSLFLCLYYFNNININSFATITPISTSVKQAYTVEYIQIVYKFCVLKLLLPFCRISTTTDAAVALLLLLIYLRNYYPFNTYMIYKNKSTWYSFCDQYLSLEEM